MQAALRTIAVIVSGYLVGLLTYPLLRAVRVELHTTALATDGQTLAARILFFLISCAAFAVPLALAAKISPIWWRSWLLVFPPLFFLFFAYVPLAMHLHGEGPVLPINLLAYAFCASGTIHSIKNSNTPLQIAWITALCFAGGFVWIREWSITFFE